MAEWSKAAVLKTVGPKGPGGSNPSLSANIVRDIPWEIRSAPQLVAPSDIALLAYSAFLRRRFRGIVLIVKVALDAHTLVIVQYPSRLTRDESETYKAPGKKSKKTPRNHFPRHFARHRVGLKARFGSASSDPADQLSHCEHTLSTQLIHKAGHTTTTVHTGATTLIQRCGSALNLNIQPVMVLDAIIIMA